MQANFSVSWSANWGNKRGGDKRKLSPQEEYWLDRILRDHSKQIFVVVVLLLLTVVGSIVVAVIYGDRVENGASYSVIEIKGGK